MKIKYTGNRPAEIVPASGRAPFTVKPEQVVEVDEKTGKSLLEQPRKWAKAPDKPDTKKGQEKDSK